MLSLFLDYLQPATRGSPYIVCLYFILWFSQLLLCNKNVRTELNHVQIMYGRPLFTSLFVEYGVFHCYADTQIYLPVKQKKKTLGWP